MKHFRLAWVSLACVVVASGQAVVESAILTGAGAGGAAAGAKGAGAAAAGVLSRLNEIAGKSAAAPEKSAAAPEKSAAPAQQAASKGAVVTVVPANSPAVPQLLQLPRPIDASLVKPGLTRDRLIACCGEPSMRITETKKSKFVETMWYTTSDEDELKVQLEEGIVTLVLSSRTTLAKQQ